ncbi:hypothetical protein [Pseudanabaena sp. CCNP1317]|uniref:hypothetical protein n=1 Tax=Pseudanabaena sp. CCNP1317 TaxID=3110253 RepID=UPI002B1EEF50|nr:hypothetical protein [Pseudanabaena sp. CCNP1317]MEA5486337.1 hypothetical protein [Pseudanabaena sp. CCNP1317]
MLPFIDISFLIIPFDHPSRMLTRSCLHCNYKVVYKQMLSTGQKFNGVEESLGIEMDVKDDMTQKIKTKTKNAFR